MHECFPTCDFPNQTHDPGCPNWTAPKLVEEPVEVRLERFRRRGTVTMEAIELEAFANDLLSQAEQNAKKRSKTREPEVWTASDELNAVKYAREQGFITKLEAQRKVRKLLRLAGKRALADATASRRRRGR